MLSCHRCETQAFLIRSLASDVVFVSQLRPDTLLARHFLWLLYWHFKALQKRAALYKNTNTGHIFINASTFLCLEIETLNEQKNPSISWVQV
jgi:hypothetical protein